MFILFEHIQAIFRLFVRDIRGLFDASLEHFIETHSVNI